MRAMILAAGRGERMRPLTDVTPKPLLIAGGKPLIVHHIERLVAAGITDIVINTAWLGEKIESALKDGAQWGAHIKYSREEQALETAGGIAHARPLLGDAPFLIVNGDVYVEWDMKQVHEIQRTVMAQDRDVWLMLVPNPAHHPSGDFSLDPDGLLHAPGGQTLTYAGIGVYAPRCFDAIAPNTSARLAPLIRKSIEAARAVGNCFTGEWRDIGTTERLAHLDAYLLAGQNVKQSML